MAVKRAVFFFCFLAFGIQAQAGDYRRPAWGENESSIRQGLNGSIPDVQTGGEALKALFLNDRVAELDTFVIYLLVHDQLVQTKYLFAQNHLQYDNFLPDFAQVEADLRRRYGPPLETGERWRGGASREPATPGKMIAVGELVLMSRWETEDSVITHVLRGENLDVDHEINYMSKRIGKTEGNLLQQFRPPQRLHF